MSIGIPYIMLSLHFLLRSLSKFQVLSSLSKFSLIFGTKFTSHDVQREDSE